MVVGASDVDDNIVLGPETGPTRLCVVTRLELPPEALIRFVAAPDGTIVADLARKLPGRGVWVSCDRRHLATAIKTKVFARSLKRPVEIAADLADRVEEQLQQRMLAALAMANKAGQVVLGFVKIEKAIAAGEVRCLLHAREAASDGAGKLDRKLAALAAELKFEPRIVRTLAVAQLSLAMGRSNVIHAALKPGGAAKAFSREAGRLARYRSDETSDEATSAASQAGSAQPDLDTERV